jgi:hypothetical protein
MLLNVVVLLVSYFFSVNYAGFASNNEVVFCGYPKNEVVFSENSNGFFWTSSFFFVVGWVPKRLYVG